VSPRLVPLPDGLVFDGSLDLSRRRTPRQRAHDKGARLERLARRLFEATGYLVESAPKVIRWQKKQKDDATLVPRTARHDLFGIWDLVCVSMTGRVAFVQVTTPENKSHKRSKILATEWPQSQEHKDDLILGYAGRGIFRVWLGPDYTREALPRHVPPERKRKK
jgi:hypothetical protein